jgi:hypothetical protein
VRRVGADDVLNPLRLLGAAQRPADDTQNGLRVWCEKHDPELLTAADALVEPGLSARLAAAVDAVVKAAHDDYQRAPGIRAGPRQRTTGRCSNG